MAYEGLGFRIFIAINVEVVEIARQKLHGSMIIG